MATHDVEFHSPAPTRKLSNIIANYATQLTTTNFQALGAIYLALGIRRATSILSTFPALVLTPMFTFWTFGPISSKGCCVYRKNETKIHLSFRLTWINAIFTSCINGGFLAYAWVHNIVNVRNIYKTPLSWNDECFIVACYMAPLPIVSLLLIQFLGKCSCCCCKPFKENCLPLTQKVIYNTTTDRAELQK